MFEDRFDGARYVNDVSYLIRLQPDPRDEQGFTHEVWIPERLIHRLAHLALAYGLPLLSRLPAAQNYEEWTSPGIEIRGPVCL